MVVSFRGRPKRLRPHAGLPFGAVSPNRRKDGRFRVRPHLDERSRLACVEGKLPSTEHASLLREGRRGPAAPRRDSGLEAHGRRFRPQQNRRAIRRGEEDDVLE
ncbi:hypothetical protein ATC00_12565 [Sinorhizobium americanum]|nr:hypothetical protein ATC00_12565 [Sinorhizobium americanum]